MPLDEPRPEAGHTEESASSSLPPASGLGLSASGAILSDESIDGVRPYRLPQTLEEKFWERVAIGEPDECWLWQGGKTVGGYGLLSFRRKTYSAHRLAWEIDRGKSLIPGRESGRVVMHRCDVRLCANPRHLAVGTSGQNTRDAWRKGRMVGNINGHRLRGEEHPSAKLTWLKVRAMRDLFAAGYSRRELALIFDVARPRVALIVAGKAWKDTA